MGATNRFEPLRRTYKTDTATNAESSQELADIYENWADDYDRRILSYGYSTPRGCGRVLWPLREARRRASTRRRGGHGLMGEVFAPLSYGELVGIDISREMAR